MSDDQFTKLCTYAGKRFDDMNKKLDEVELDSADIRGAIRKFSAQFRDYYNEITFSSQ
jgi:hypothetical protein